MKKRMIGILLILCLLWTMIPAGAFASETESIGVWVGGVEVTADNCADVLGDGTVSYNSDKQVLTLNNAVITATASPDGVTDYGIYAAQDLWLVLKGSSSVTVETTGQHTGVRIKGSAVISGTGSLQITTSDCDASAFGSASYGLSVAADLLMEGGTVTVTAGNGASDAESIGVWAGTSIMIMDGTLNAAAGTGSVSVGIGSGDSYLQSGGTVTAISDRGGVSYGVFLYGSDLYVAGSDSSLTATAGQSNGLSAGISCYALTVDGADVTGESASQNDTGCKGIEAVGILLVGGRIKGIAHETSSTSSSVGVFANCIFVDGGELTGISDAAAAGHAAGVYSAFLSDELEGAGTIDLQGYGKITGRCDGSVDKENYYAVMAERGIHISEEHTVSGHAGTFTDGITSLKQAAAGTGVTIRNGDPQKYWIYTENDGQGLIFTDVDRAAAGETVTILDAPNDGMELDTVTVQCINGQPVPVKGELVSGVMQYSFVMPDSDVIVSGTFRTELPYYAQGTSGDLSWELSKEGVLTFTGTGAMENYTGKTQMPWYPYRDLIRAVILKDGVTSVGDYAFYGMDIPAIHMAESVTRIGDYAFKNCTKLYAMELPSQLTYLGDSAFYGCTALKTVDIPATLYTVRPYTFKNCTGLTAVTFPEGNLMKLSDGAFYGCTTLTEITLPKCLDIIDSYCFKNCTKLATVTMPAGDLTEIREAVFYGTALTSLNLPEGITKVGSYAFKNCTALTTVNLPSTLQTVREAAFYNCNQLASLSLPDALTTIGNYAFRKCTGLTAVEFGTGLQTIGESAFYGCTGLTGLTLHDALTTIGAYAFKSCTGLTTVEFGSGLKTIGESAFHTCTGLKTLTFPASLTTVGDYAFSGSWNLYRLTFTGDAPAIGTGAFKTMSATAYYTPGDSWTETVMQNYGGTITWKAQ